MTDRYWFTADEARLVIASIWLKITVVWYAAAGAVAAIDPRVFTEGLPLLFVPIVLGAICWYVAPPKGAPGKY